jgi:hypothetical protein
VVLGSANQLATFGPENYWSLLKRCIRGIYISVEPSHLFRSLDEQAFRFNEREHADDTVKADGERFVDVAGISPMRPNVRAGQAGQY